MRAKSPNSVSTRKATAAAGMRNKAKPVAESALDELFLAEMQERRQRLQRWLRVIQAEYRAETIPRSASCGRSPRPRN